MVIVKASVQSEGEKYFIEIALEDDAVRIPMSEDSPNQIKGAFNRLIQRSRSGEFRIELQVLADDLFFHVAREYVAQLNKELAEVRAELDQYGLLIETPESSD